MPWRMEKREEVVRRMGEAQQGSVGEEKRGKTEREGRGRRGNQGVKKWKKTEGEHLPAKLHPSLSLSIRSYSSEEAWFVYRQASSDSLPALQIKLTAGATGIHYTRRARRRVKHRSGEKRKARQ